MLGPSVCVPFHLSSDESVTMSVGVMLGGGFPTIDQCYGGSQLVLFTVILCKRRFFDGTSSGINLWPVVLMKCTLQMRVLLFISKSILPIVWIHCFKISLLLISNLKYERFVSLSLFDRSAQLGTLQKCTIVTITWNSTHAPPTVFSNYANVSNEYVLLCKLHKWLTLRDVINFVWQ